MKAWFLPGVTRGAPALPQKSESAHLIHTGL